ncbi:hypothetical protein M0805_003332 [Coniferiporia weirii]|nr:hypothetical protein M0805_003332 [Coniferiporia weirii]
MTSQPTVQGAKSEDAEEPATQLSAALQTTVEGSSNVRNSDEVDYEDERPSHHVLEHRWKASDNVEETSSVLTGSHGIKDLGLGEDKFVNSDLGDPAVGETEVRHPESSHPSLSLRGRSSTELKHHSGNLSQNDAPPLSSGSRRPGETSGIDVAFANALENKQLDGQKIDNSSAVPNPEFYHRFYWKCMELKSELVRLDFALRSVGSSGPGILAANNLKTRLRHLRDLFGVNTSFLFPDDDNIRDYAPKDPRVYLLQISRSFEDFAKGLDMTAKALNDFNGVYHDENLMSMLFTLHGKFMAQALKTSVYGEWSLMVSLFLLNLRLFHLGIHHTRKIEELRIYFQAQLGSWVEIAIESLTKSVKDFNDRGVQTIYSSRRHKTSRYLDMTTIATFFSAVTASMIQFTINNNSDPVSVATNTFMFSSLVFSIGSAVNSLLTTAWRRSFVREPNRVLPIWFSAWLNAGPMVSLVVAGAFFSVALCLLMFSSSQHVVTTVVVVAFSGFHAAGLLLLSIFFILEKWNFRGEAGPIGNSLTGDSLTLSLVDGAMGLIKILKRLQGQARHPVLEKDRERSYAMEAQTIFPEKVELLMSSKSQSLQNAFSDEPFILGSTYISNLVLSKSSSQSPETKRSYDSWRSRFTFRAVEGGSEPLYANAEGRAFAWGPRIRPGSSVLDSNNENSLGQRASSVFFRRMRTEIDHEPDAPGPNPVPRHAASENTDRIYNPHDGDPSSGRETPVEMRMPEQESPESEDTVSYRSSYKSGEDSPGIPWTGSPEELYERRRPAQPRRHRQTSSLGANASYSSSSPSIRRHISRIPTRLELTESVVGAGSDVRAAAQFLEPPQGWAAGQLDPDFLSTLVPPEELFRQFLTDRDRFDLGHSPT